MQIQFSETPFPEALHNLRRLKVNLQPVGARLLGAASAAHLKIYEKQMQIGNLLR